MGAVTQLEPRLKYLIVCHDPDCSKLVISYYLVNVVGTRDYRVSYLGCCSRLELLDATMEVIIDLAVKRDVQEVRYVAEKPVNYGSSPPDLIKQLKNQISEVNRKLHRLASNRLFKYNAFELRPSDYKSSTPKDKFQERLNSNPVAKQSWARNALGSFTAHGRERIDLLDTFGMFLFVLGVISPGGVLHDTPSSVDDMFALGGRIV